ncbi:MAG: DUF3987 domain-containing protein [Gaiellaceae bacterium]
MSETRLPVLEPAALHGPAGEYALAVAPYTEACPAAVLVSSLVAFGNAVNRNVFVPTGATTHHTNEFVLLVGPTAIGRKGDGMTIGIRPIELANPEWRECLLGGFGSGEAVVEAVRDAKRELDDEGNEKVVEAGAADKRLLVFEEELGHVIAVASREGSTLSSLWRKAWDGRRLENRTKGRRLIATDAHVSALAGITPEELLRKMPETEFANGFMNRWLVVLVERARLLPDPPRIPPAFDEEWSGRFAEALAYTRRSGAGMMKRVGAAKHLWDRAYREELSIRRDGLAGAICARAEAHTLRLSMLYALLDRSKTIRYEHVEAALALWRYCEQSAYMIFGHRLGDSTADAILDELRRGELTRTDVNNLFGGHRKAGELDRALALLVRQRLAIVEERKTGGRLLTVYAPAEKAEEAEKGSAA